MRRNRNRSKISCMQPWYRARDRAQLVGVVHLGPTPGAPRFAGDAQAVLDAARADARTLLEGGVDALIVENFGDAPFFATRVPAETVAFLAMALQAVAEEAGSAVRGVARGVAEAAAPLDALTGRRIGRYRVLAGTSHRR